MSRNYKSDSYVQLYLDAKGKDFFSLGLYKDIDKPYVPPFPGGTVPSFIVDDVKATLVSFQSKNVVIDKTGDSFMISNTSDNGCTDIFFFVRDPDNNSLVIRQNLCK